MHTVTKILRDSETVFYIFFLTNNLTMNKQPLKLDCLTKTFSFLLFLLTFDKEQKLNSLLFYSFTER